jgi:hypothetical protein
VHIAMRLTGVVGNWLPAPNSSPIVLWAVGSLALPTVKKSDIFIIRFRYDFTVDGLVFIREN